MKFKFGYTEYNYNSMVNIEFRPPPNKLHDIQHHDIRPDIIEWLETSVDEYRVFHTIVWNHDNFEPNPNFYLGDITIELNTDDEVAFKLRFM